MGGVTLKAPNLLQVINNIRKATADIRKGERITIGIHADQNPRYGVEYASAKEATYQLRQAQEQQKLDNAKINAELKSLRATKKEAGKTKQEKEHISASVRQLLARKKAISERVARLSEAKSAAQKAIAGSTSGPTTAEVAAWNHFGTKHIPARPFLDVAIRERRRSITKAGLEVYRRTFSLGLAADAMGAYAVGVVQKYLSRNNIPPPLSPETIKRKGSSHALIDTGQLRQSITWRRVNGK